MHKRLECKISGRVQLVMFRDFAKRKAQSLKLTGSVENLNDGKVFIVAEGEEAQLKEFLIKLEKGPLGAKINKIETKWDIPKEDFTDFNIIYYGKR